MLLALAYFPSSFDCTEEYEYFLSYYQKQSSSDSQRVFCANLAELENVKRTCADCQITRVFDVDLASVVSRPQMLEKTAVDKKATYTCEQVLCTAEDPLIGFTQIPASTDLRMLGLIPLSRDQQSCGSCWSFALSGAFENSLLLDGFSEDAHFLDLSEQYIMSNIEGFNKACSGGDSIAALAYIVENPSAFPTVEFEQNYPYNPVKIPVNLPPKLEYNEYILPFRTFPLQQNYVPQASEAAAVSLMGKTGKFDANLVKQYISRGIAVIAAMSTKVSPKGAFALSSYGGTAALGGFPCGGAALDHQVLIIGYGKFKGKNAWLVRNSWGADWGNFGSFYVAEGGDDFCIEEYAYAIIPRAYDLMSTEFAQNSPRPTPYSIERGITGFDKDNGEYIIIHKIDWTMIVVAIVSAFVLTLVATVIVTCVVMRCRRGSTMRAGSNL